MTSSLQLSTSGFQAFPSRATSPEFVKRGLRYLKLHAPSLACVLGGGDVSSSRIIVKMCMEAGTRVHCLSYCTLEYDKSTTHDIMCMGLAV